MILSRGRKYVFIHIPKTGGTSLAMALEARAMKDDIMLGDTPKALKRRRKVNQVQAAGRLWKHSKLVDLVGLIDPVEVADLHVVTLVRNPWARLVSYYHWLQKQSFDHGAVERAKAMDFSQFVSDTETQSSIKNNSYSSYTSLPNVTISPDFIRLEAFDEDSAAFQAHLGFKLELPHLNSSQAVTDYRTFYTKATQALVAQMCAEDIQKFGYSF